MSEKPRFHAGGSLPAGALYVERPADRELCEGLLAGEFCYVLAPRQIGKSSLRVRASRWLKDRGVLCATIDLTRIGGTCTDPEQWYYGLVEEVSRKLKLPHAREFWLKQQGTTPVHRFVLYLRGEVLQHLERRVVIFIDEIDSLMALPFSTDDFFAAVRDAYNARAEDDAYERLTFCLMGVATPGELIKNPARTPFNIGKGIRLVDFTPEEARALLPGLQGLRDDPERLLGAVLEWTSGHPYMTQRVCEALMREAQKRGEPPGEGDGDVAGAPNGAPEERVARIVTEAFLRRGRSEEPNLTYAESRLEQSPHVQELLRLYGRLLTGERPSASLDDPDQLLLRLTGMAAEESEPDGAVLRVRNRIFATVFDRAWVREKERRGLFNEPLLRWRDSGRREDFLLRGQALREAIEWSRGRQDLSTEEHEFLLQGLELARSEEEERRKATEEERRAELERERRQRLEQVALAQRRSLVLLATMVVVLSGLLITVGWQYRKVQRAEAAQRAARAAEARAKVRAQEVSLTERGLRAALLSRQPGEEITALITAIRAVGPSIKDKREPLGPELQGLAAASSVLLWSMPLRGHGQGVQTATFSPDGRRVITASLDGTARLWDSASGQALAVLRGHQEPVVFAHYSADGRRVLTGGRDGTARLWDGAGRILFVLRGHLGAVTAGAFSPDGRLLATASEDRTARIWDVATGRQLLVLEGHRGPLRWVTFSPDSRRVITTSAERGDDHGNEGADHTARLYDTTSGALLAVLSGHEDGVLMASFSPDGRRVVTASLDRTARIWDAASGRQLGVLRGHAAPVTSALYAPDGKLVVTTSLDGTACTWNERGGKPLVALRGHSGGIVSASFSRDGKHLITASTDSTARVWDVQTGSTITVLQGHSETLHWAAFSPDGNRAVTASEDHTARLWNNSARAARVLKGHADRVLSAAFSSDGTLVATASADHTARLWDGRTGQAKSTLLGHEDIVYSAAFSPDGTRVVTASRDRTARIWEVATSRELYALRGHRDSVWSAAFSPDSRLVLTTSADGTVRVWDSRTGQPGPVLGNDLFAATFSSDERIATAGLDGTARIWGAWSGVPLTVLRGHRGGVWAVGFSADGSRLATGGRDRTARIWDTRSGRLLSVLQGHSDAVISVAFSPDGSRVVTTGMDRSARVWEIRTGAHLAFLSSQTEDPRPTLLSASFSADGRWLLTGFPGRTARLWNVADGQRLTTLRSQTPPLPGGEEQLEQETGLPLPYLARTGGAVSFSPDGQRVIAVLGKNSASIQQATANSFFAVACGLLRYQPELRQAPPPREFAEAAEYCAPYFGR